MTTAPHGMGDTATIYRLCTLFRGHPELAYEDISIRKSGRIEIHAEGTNGVLKSWSRALPSHVHTTALVPTQYGLDEADVIEEAGIVVTIRRPLVGPGGVA